MLAFENKNLWDCYFPLEPAKRILNAADVRLDQIWRVWTLLQCVERVPPFLCFCSYLVELALKLDWENLVYVDFPSSAHRSSRSICTWALCVHLPPEIQPEHQRHSDKWIVTGPAYRCQRQAPLWDFDSALFPQLNRRLCFAKQTNKQATWRVWWKSKQHGPVTCPTTMTLPK